MSLRFQFHNAMHAFFPQDIRRFSIAIPQCKACIFLGKYVKCQHLNNKLRDVFPISKTQVYSHLVISQLLLFPPRPQFVNAVIVN